MIYFEAAKASEAVAYSTVQLSWNKVQSSPVYGFWRGMTGQIKLIQKSVER